MYFMMTVFLSLIENIGSTGLKSESGLSFVRIAFQITEMYFNFAQRVASQCGGANAR